MQTGMMVPLEVVAAISAALVAYMDMPADQFRIRSIAPLGVTTASAWVQAGRLDQHRFREDMQARSR